MPLLFLKTAMSATGRFLSRLSLWQFVSRGRAGLCLFLYATGQGEKRGRVKAEARLVKLSDEARRANDAKDRIERESVRITKDIKDRHDEQDRRIAATARAIGLRGPGAARCPASVPTRPAGPVKAGAVPDVAGPDLPPADFAAVPWSWLTTRAEQHDILRTEVLTWREWHRLQSEVRAGEAR